MAERVRAYDWATTPLGPRFDWPPHLHTTLNLVLNSGFPMWLAWGEKLTFLYNDAFRPHIGRKPDPLGMPLAEAAAEAWPTLAPIAERTLRGEGAFFENFPVPLQRYGYRENTWWTFAYSPVFAESGEVAGILCVGHETTGEVNARAALGAERERLARLLEQAPSNVAFLAGPDHVYTLVNEAHRKLAAGRELVGRRVRDVFPELEGQGLFEALDDVYSSGRPHVTDGLRLRLAQPGGGSREHFVDMIMQPITGEDGAVSGIFVEGHDVTERMTAEAALSEREERLRLAVDAGRMGTWDLDVGSGAVALSVVALAMLGLPEDCAFSMAEFEADSLPGEFDRMKASLKEARARQDPFFEVEFRHRRADDGRIRWFLIRGRSEFVMSGGVLRCFGVLMDLTERKEAEDRLRLLAREVDHRANNLLAAVQSVVNLTRAKDVPTFRERIRGRLGALANAHRLLAESRWTGAGLARVVGEELEAYRGGRVHLSGPDARLSPPVAQALAIALHELATNAAKYGSLSTPHGRTSVTWTRPNKARIVHLSWQEQGGPPASEPSQPGFGTTLLKRAFAGQRGGEVELEWRSEGLRCRLSFPVL